MVAHVHTVAFLGIEAVPVEAQISISNGLPSFTIVGLPTKAVAESRERVRAALTAIGLSLPSQRITVNLAPADLLKEGSHFDLPIACGLLIAMGVLPVEDMANYVVLGELGLDGSVARVNGILPAAFAAHASDCGLICPAAQGSEAIWAGGEDILAAPSLLLLINHFKGLTLLSKPVARPNLSLEILPDLADVKGQETAKRVLEIAAAGRHNLLMIGPPGSGKSMLARCMPSLLPPLSPREALEVSMIHSLSGLLPDGEGLISRRPYRTPHHSTSVPALVGGGFRAKPGEISLAHHGVLFLDELPEFPRSALESLRQPLESGKITVSRANGHITYPARFQLLAAMNPCQCGWVGIPAKSCAKAPRCVAHYQARLSGPLIDRIDLQIEVASVPSEDLARRSDAETSAAVAERVARAIALQEERYQSLAGDNGPKRNAEVEGRLLDLVATPDKAGQELLAQVMERLQLSARSYHRILRVARTLADLDGGGSISRFHIAEALSYRQMVPGQRL